MVTTVNPTKEAEPIKMPFAGRGQTRVGQRNRALDGNAHWRYSANRIIDLSSGRRRCELTPPLLQQLVIITLATSMSGHRHEAHLVRARHMAPYKSVLIDRSIYRQSKA